MTTQSERDDSVEDLSIEEPESAPQAAPVETSDIPEKYKGKSTTELVAMLAEQERFSGKQSQEVGELRRSVDSLIQAQLKPQAESVVTPTDEVIDFFDDPDRAIEQRISNHPQVKRAAESAQKYERMTSTTQLKAKHPDMEAIVSDEKFLQWVQASPIRTSLLQNAHHNYDFASADELFTNWKERQQIVTDTVAMEKKERAKTVQAASTGNTHASSASAPVKRYRRGDIIDLMNRDPDRYMRMADEFLEAYRTGRVVN